MILNMHTDTQLGLSDCSPWEATHATVLEVKDTGGERGASETAGEQGKGVRNNRNDQAACCLTGNGMKGWGGGRPGPQRPHETNSFTSSCFLPPLDHNQYEK